MSARSLCLLLSFQSALAGCVYDHAVTNAPPLVEIPDLVASPANYDGKRISVEGWAVRSSEDYNLYPTRSAACNRSGRSNAVGAEWDDSQLSYPSMRKGVFDATFKNKLFKKQPGGSIIVSTGMSIGPLDDIHVVRWTSAPKPPCR